MQSKVGAQSESMHWKTVKEPNFPHPAPVEVTLILKVYKHVFRIEVSLKVGTFQV